MTLAASTFTTQGPISVNGGEPPLTYELLTQRETNMTRKDYEFIARQFKQELLLTNCSPETIQVLITLTKRIADAAQKDNPKFDYDKFLAACGL